MMRRYFSLSVSIMTAALFVFMMAGGPEAQKKALDTINLQLEGAKLAPTPFPHPTYVGKAKVECVTCHHKEKTYKNPTSVPSVTL